MICSSSLVAALATALAVVGGPACGTRPTTEALRPAAAENTARAVPAPAPARAIPVGKTEPRLLDLPEARILEALAEGDVEKVTKGSGGRSLAFKLSLENGVAGYFKPEQSFASNWYSELASYYLDRELGLGRVPPAIGRRLEWRVLAAAAGRDERLHEVVIRKGRVRGSMVYWLEGPLAPVELPAGWESWLRLDERREISPFQDLPSYRRALKQGRVDEAAPPPLDESRAAELSDLVVFDYLIGNLDRWSRDLTNVRTLGAKKRLIFFDNSNGFEVKAKPSWLLARRLKAVQRFRKTTIEAIRALDREKLVARMATDPLAPLLNEAQLDQLEERRARLLAHVAALERAHGSRVLSF